MERLGRGGPWTLLAVTAVLISGSVVSCSNNVTPAMPAPATEVSNASGTAASVPTATETPRAELKVPTDLINKSADAAQMQLSAAGIPFTTSFREVEDTRVGVVLEVDPVGGTVLSQGDSVRLLVGKAKEVLPVTPIRPGDLGITEIEFTRLAESANCNLTVTAFNHLLENAEGITVMGYLQMRDQGNTRITLNFSQSSGLETLEPQEYHQFRGYITFFPGITASYRLQIVQGTTVIDEVMEQVATCA